jgi:MFS family permease
MSSPAHHGQSEGMPPGLGNAYIFALFNALSFQVVLSSPMVLYARSLNASATVLGLITGMMPLLVIFQIPAAAYISRVGYKKFVYAGWGMRVLFICVMAGVPLTSGFLNPTTRLALVLALLFAFNLSRGISSAAWLPWITGLVPTDARGRFLSREAAFVNIASFFSFLLSAICLWRDPAGWQFALLFAFSAAMGGISLSFLKRIPDGPPPEHGSRSTQAVPWGAMLRYLPFTKLLREVVAWSLAYGGVQAFCVAFLRTGVGLAEGEILAVCSVSFLGGLSSQWFLGGRLDALGSKPVLTFCLAAWIGVMLGWMALAGGAWPTSWLAVILLQFVMGLLAALVQMANTRLAMGIIPVMGRTHFFALFSVIGSLALGLSPVLWGLMLDAIGETQWKGVGLSWTRYSLFFACVAVAMGIGLWLARRLEEPSAGNMEALLREILASPQRVLVRFWPRG